MPVRTVDSTPFAVTETEPSEDDAATFLTPRIAVNALEILRSHPPQSIPDTLNSNSSARENKPMLYCKMLYILKAMVDRWVAIAKV